MANRPRLLFIDRIVSLSNMAALNAYAGVAELVDALDSKSSSPGECRFESDHPYHFPGNTMANTLELLCFT